MDGQDGKGKQLEKVTLGQLCQIVYQFVLQKSVKIVKTKYDYSPLKNALEIFFFTLQEHFVHEKG